MIIKNNLNEFAKISAVLLAGGVLAQGNSFKNFGEIFNSDCIVANAFESREKGYEILKRDLEAFQKGCELYYDIIDGEAGNISDIKSKINNFVSSINEARKSGGLSNPILGNLANNVENKLNAIRINQNLISNAPSRSVRIGFERINNGLWGRIHNLIFKNIKSFKNFLLDFINNFATKYGTFDPNELTNIKFFSDIIVNESYKFYAKAIYTDPMTIRSDNEKVDYKAHMAHSYAELQKIFDVNKSQPKSSDDAKKDSIVDTAATKDNNDKKKGIALSKDLGKKDVSKGTKDVFKDTKGVPKTSIDASSNLLGFTISSGIVGISSLISSLKIKRRKK